MMAKGKLSDRQRRMLDFIQHYSREHGYPPSIREIGEAVGISSTSVVNYNLNRLVEEGYLDRHQNVSRGLRLTDKLASAADRLGDVLRVPLVGRIFASQPVLFPGTDTPVFGADEGIEIARGLLPVEDGLFALQVKGDSMIDAMVNDGDIVILKPAQEARNGEMVAVWLSDRNETTLKFFFKEKDRYRLQPANPTMKPIYVDKGEALEIKGKVVMVIRKVEKYN
jgi:repressor LexA